MNTMLASVEKGSVKLTEYSDSTFNYEDKLFLQHGCVGFYLTRQELKDLHTIVDYYLNIDEISQVKIIVDGEHVALQ